MNIYTTGGTIPGTISITAFVPESEWEALKKRMLRNIAAGMNVSVEVLERIAAQDQPQGKPEHRSGFRINMEEMKEGITMAAGEIDRMAKAVKNILPEREAERVKRFREIADKYFETRGVQFFPSDRDRSSLAEFIREEAEAMADTWRADRRRGERERECELLDFIRSAMPAGTIPPNRDTRLSEAVRIMARYIVRGLPSEVEELQKLTAENATLKNRAAGLESLLLSHEARMKEQGEERDRLREVITNSALEANSVARSCGLSVVVPVSGSGLEGAIYAFGNQIKQQATKLRESHIDRQAIIDRLTKKAAEKEAELEAIFDEFCEAEGGVIPGIDGAADFMRFLVSRIGELKSGESAAMVALSEVGVNRADRGQELAAADALARTLRARLTASEAKVQKLEKWAQDVETALKASGIVGLEGTAVEVVRQVALAVADYRALQERCKGAELARDNALNIAERNVSETVEIRRLKKLIGKIARRLTRCRAKGRAMREFIKRLTDRKHGVVLISSIVNEAEGLTA